MHNADNWGEIVTKGQVGLLDCAYFSFSTFSTLGYGDVVATGPIRYLVGLEALVGLVLIGWTTSFLFMEMYEYWNKSLKNSR